MQTSKCPVCNSDVIVGDEIYEEDIVECANCDSISEIVTLHPITLRTVEDNSGIKSEEEE